MVHGVQYIKDIRKLDPGIGGPKLWYMQEQELDSPDFSQLIPILDSS